MAKKKSFNNEPDKEELSGETNSEVSSLNEDKTDGGNGFFHIRTRTKWVSGISFFMLFLTSCLIYATVQGGMGAEMWQVAVWGLCGILALYSIFSRSIAALLLNLVLFFGVSLIPAWQIGYDYFHPVIERIEEAN